jgi:hypothetical protein
MKGLMVTLLFLCATGIVVGQQSDLDGEANASSERNIQGGESAMFSPSLRPPNALKSKSTGFDFAKARELGRPGPDDSDDQSVIQVALAQSTTTSRQAGGMSAAERFRSRSGANGFDRSSNETNESALRFDVPLGGEAFDAIRLGKKIEAAVDVVNPANQQRIPASRFGEIAFFNSANASKKLTAQTVEPVEMPVGSTTLRFEVDESQLLQLEQNSLKFRVPDALRGRFNKVEIAGKRSLLDTGGSFGLDNTAGGGGWNVAPVPEPGPNTMLGGSRYVGPVIDNQEIRRRQMASLKERPTADSNFNNGFSGGTANNGLQGNSIDDMWEQQKRREQEKQRQLALDRESRNQTDLGFDSQNQGQNSSQNYQLAEYQRRLEQAEAALAASKKTQQQYRDQATSLYQQNVGLNQEQLAMKEQLERQKSQANSGMVPVGLNGFGSNRADFSGNKTYHAPQDQTSAPNYQLAALQQQLEKAKTDNEYLKWQQDNMQRQYDVAKSRQDQKYENSVISAALQMMSDRNETKPVTPTSGNFNPNGFAQGNRGQQELDRFADRNALTAEQLAKLKAGQAPQVDPSLKNQFGAAISGPPNVNNGRPRPLAGGNEQPQTAMNTQDYSKTLMALLFLLFGSIGLNLYLGWLCRSWYVQYGYLSEELREMFSASSSKI